MTAAARHLPACFAACALLALASPATEGGFPYTEEALDYTVNWPSGLSLGEGHLRARKNAGRWEFELVLDAAIPGLAISDRYRSLATGDLCSLEFEKESAHGSRKAREKTVFEYKKGIARRSTLNGGKTEVPIPGCARDALDFVFFARRELAQGRLPPPQPVLFGAPYQVSLDYTGEQVVSVNERKRMSERVVVHLKGPASDTSLELFFARDAARTPLVIRAPFAMGTFSMELVR